MEKHIVAKLSELRDGCIKIVQVNNIEIGLYNVNNKLYALRSICPHQGASLCKGVLTGTNLPSAVNEYKYGREKEIVRCPWHNWEFDVKTGYAIHDPSVRVATYEVVQEGENIILYL